MYFIILSFKKYPHNRQLGVRARVLQRKISGETVSFVVTLWFSYHVLSSVLNIWSIPHAFTMLNVLYCYAPMLQSKTLTTLTMNYTLTNAMEDIATMADLLYGTSSFMTLIRDLPDLQDLPSLLHKIPGLVDSVIHLGVTDLSWWELLQLSVLHLANWCVVDILSFNGWTSFDETLTLIN